MPLRRTYRLVVLTFLILYSTTSAYGARFPNSVAKTFSVSAELAVTWAKVLRLPLDRGVTLSLPLRPNEVTARSLRGNSGYLDSVSNQIIWDPRVPSLKITGDWLDQTTGSNRKGPRFIFGSPFIPREINGGGPWGDFIRSWGFPRSHEPSVGIYEPLEERSSATSKPKLTVTIYRAQSWLKNPQGEWGYQVDIGVDEF